MGRARVAVNATVLTTAIGVNGLLEGDVRRIVARDNRARRIHAHGRARDGRLRIEAAPAVVNGLMPVGFKPAVGIRERTPPLVRPARGFTCDDRFRQHRFVS